MWSSKMRGEVIDANKEVDGGYWCRDQEEVESKGRIELKIEKLSWAFDFFF